MEGKGANGAKKVLSMIGLSSPACSLRQCQSAIRPDGGQSMFSGYSSGRKRPIFKTVTASETF
jgi:hypothetical protein